LVLIASSVHAYIVKPEKIQEGHTSSSLFTVNASKYTIPRDTRVSTTFLLQEFEESDDNGVVGLSSLAETV